LKDEVGSRKLSISDFGFRIDCAARTGRKQSALTILTISTGSNIVILKNHPPRLIHFLLLIILAGLLNPVVSSAEDIQLSAGQIVYVPLYSHIYSGVKARPFDLAATLSIRNTNLKTSIIIVSVKYYDTAGKLIKDYLDGPIELNALASTRYIIAENDKAGGSGANFVVAWKSDQRVNPPIIESVMIGTHSGQGISFASRGQVIKEDLSK
jgi:hypothetical protein